MPRALLLAALLLTAIAAPAQWQILDSNTTADLRGIDNVGGGIVWASGSNGTVLRSEDAGYVWQRCAIPPNADHLDFRGIQAFDANTAIVMSSGKGPLSRLYKTTDGCQTWKLIFTNPDKDGFWDALAMSSYTANRDTGMVLGDPVNGHFPMWIIGKNGAEAMEHLAHASKHEACFAASNESLFVWDVYNNFVFATGGQSGSYFIRFARHGVDELSFGKYSAAPVPVGNHTDSSGIFSIALDLGSSLHPNGEQPFGSGHWVAVGGDYQNPDDATNIAASSFNEGKDWTAATTPPHGYRSSVAYDPTHDLWITVGPNGTDISTDDGRNWRALHPNPALHDPPDADRNWNALSLPFVVGPHGRIGLLEPSALLTASH